MPDMLAQTLRVATDRASHTVTHAPEVAVFPATAADMQDASNLTGSVLVVTNQGGPASGEYREDWVLDSATEPGPYSFVRVAVSGKRVNGAGVHPITVYYLPSIDGVKRGEIAGINLLDGGTDNAQDFALDPADGLPWTAAKVNAQRWGWWIVAFLQNPSDFDESAQGWITEYRLELWVPEPLPPAPPPSSTHESPYTQMVLEDHAAYWGGR